MKINVIMDGNSQIKVNCISIWHGISQDCHMTHRQGHGGVCSARGVAGGSQGDHRPASSSVSVHLRPE